MAWTLELEILVPRPLLRLGAIGALVLGAAPNLGSESVSLTTYYPAPVGVYTTATTSDTTYLARDTGRVGIGTASPSASYKLDVAGGDVRGQNVTSSQSFDVGTAGTNTTGTTVARVTIASCSPAAANSSCGANQYAAFYQGLVSRYQVLPSTGAVIFYCCPCPTGSANCANGLK